MGYKVILEKAGVELAVAAAKDGQNYSVVVVAAAVVIVTQGAVSSQWHLQRRQQE